MGLIMGQAVSVEDSSRIEVKIPGQGTVTGYTIYKSQTAVSYRFCKVPYALPCTGSNRFRKPRPIPKHFDYTGDYRDLGLKCPQPVCDEPKLGYVKSASEENITYSNIWVPASNEYKPKNGWPVLVYIHGGWLQNGTPNSEIFNAVELFDDEEFKKKFILVCPGYRLNMFGFLSCKELLEEDPESSNFGFWDQRAAIEWTFKNIEHFGGDPTKITVGGLSAGAYSTFFQLSYELYHPEAVQVIKQVIYFSNCFYVQPKSIEESQEQFDEVCTKLKISPTLTVSEKLAALRGLDASFIEDFISTLRLHTFRAVTDGVFVSPTILQDLVSGNYTSRLIKKNIRIMCGDVNNEGFTYSLLNTPKTLKELEDQIENYYPKKVVSALLNLYDCQNLGTEEEIKCMFGRIVADGQVYASERGYLEKISSGGFKNIFRYRISFRMKYLDGFLDPKFKVPHGCDLPVWFYPLRDGFTDEERDKTNKWLEPYMSFLNFEENLNGWDNSDVRKIRWFQEDGSIVYTEDPDWDWGVKVAKAAYEAQLY